MADGRRRDPAALRAASTPTYNGAIAALHGVDLEVPSRRDRGAARRQRRRQDHAAQGRLEPAAGRARRGRPPGRSASDGLDVTRTAPGRSGRAPASCQVLEGRHCFRSLTVEENLLTGAIAAAAAARAGARRPRAGLRALPAPRRRSGASPPGLTSGGEQQMTAIGRGADVAAAALPARRAVDGPGAAGRRDIFETLRAAQRRGPLDPRRRAELRRGLALRRPRHGDRERPERARPALRPSSPAATTSRPSISAAPRARPGPRSKEHHRMTVHSRPRSSTTARAGAAGRRAPPARAHVITSDAEAIEIARALAADFAKRRVGARPRPHLAGRRSSTPSRRAGSGRSTCRKAYGGPELSYVTLNRVIAIISAADSSIGQIPQNHLGVVAAIRTVSDEAQKELLFAEVLRRHPLRQRLLRVRLQARRRLPDHASSTPATTSSSTAASSTRSGALLAHLVPIVALDDEGRAWYAIADRGAPGLTVIDDWSSFGQRTTLSRHRDPRQRQGAEDPSGARLQGLRGARPPTARSSR